MTIPSITECTTTTLAADGLRLPRNQSEGNIPKIALSTGFADALECLLRSPKLGLDDSEFTNPGGGGSVNLYGGGDMASGYLGTNAYKAGFNGGAPFPSAMTWWNDAGNLFTGYDVVMFSCEGSQYTADKSATAHTNLESYISAGGRVFASHFHNVWIQGGLGPISTVASFVSGIGGDGSDTSTITATVNQSFPKGKALATWLQNAQATMTLGQLPISHWRVTLTGRNAPLTTDWVDYSDPNAAMAGVASPASQYFSFNAPVGASAAKQCGQMVFTDIHVSGDTGGTGDTSSPMVPFPTGCKTTGLTPQEKALIFLLFDLSSCLQPT
jgi:hypothetical protein